MANGQALVDSKVLEETATGRARIFYPQVCATLKVRLDDFARGNGSGDPRLDEFYEFSVIPRKCSVKINDYLMADEFDIEVDYKDLPFDPRCIRAVSVSIHAQDMYDSTSKDGERPTIVPTEDNVIFFGFADEDSISFDDQNRSVTLEGRDNTSLLLDEKYLQGTIALNLPIDKLFRQMLDSLPSTKALKIKNLIGDLPVLASFYTDKQDGSGNKNVKRDQTYWDVIQDIALQAGLIAYIEIDSLVISKPRVLYNKTQAKTFIYGHNIKDLKFKRKIGRRKGFNLIVRGLNLEGKVPPVYTAKIPLEATPEWCRETGNINEEIKIPEVDAKGVPVTDSESKKVAPYISFKVPNVASKQQLIEIGQSLYEEISRQQIEGSFVTKELTVSFRQLNSSGVASGALESFDLFKLRNGTPVNIVIDHGDLKGLTNQDSTASRIQLLVDRGWNKKVATVFAQTLGKYSNILYTREVKMMYDSKEGVQFTIEFLNFIEVSEKFKGG